MKRTTALTIILLFSLSSFCQSHRNEPAPKITVKWAPTGLILGNVNVQAEYNFGGKHSLTANLGIPSSAHHSFNYQDGKTDFNMKSTSFLAGYRTYTSHKQLAGFYLEPYFKYVHQLSEGIGNGTLSSQPATFDFTNDYNGMGVGLQLGTQFIIKKRIIVDLFFLGPEINSSENTFKAIEINNSTPWTSMEATEAQKDIVDFLNQFPIIRNHTNVMVDKSSRVVTADFSGFVPGIRAGVSIGIAF
ncbi:MAG: DUF3575 domain-containing protein [Candidatus Dadabacteria bacterium]